MALVHFIYSSRCHFRALNNTPLSSYMYFDQDERLVFQEVRGEDVGGVRLERRGDELR